MPNRTETDLPLVAAMEMEGHKVIGVQVLTDKKTQAAFLFEETPELAAARKRYREGRCRVDPEDFTLRLKKLKGWAYSEMRNASREKELFPVGNTED